MSNYSTPRMLKHFTSAFTKTSRIPTKDEISKFKKRLSASKWVIKDDVISTYPAKQLFITTQSLLNKEKTAYMDSLDVNKNSEYGLNEKFKVGDKVPFGYSLAYCNPLSNENELSEDGYDNYHAPVLGNQEFFQRRMWVSGSFTYNTENPLKFGDSLNFEENVDKLKVLTRNKMIVADYKRVFSNQAGPSIIEHRLLCYLNSLYEQLPQSLIPDGMVPDRSITVVPTIITSFRMSALTFNSHQIHYNPEYAKNSECYPNVVVEAPLLISLALQFWRNYNTDSSLKSFQYKILIPNFINQPLKINSKKLTPQSTRLWILNKDSNVCFESTVEI